MQYISCVEIRKERKIYIFLQFYSVSNSTFYQKWTEKMENSYCVIWNERTISVWIIIILFSCYIFINYKCTIGWCPFPWHLCDSMDFININQIFQPKNTQYHYNRLLYVYISIEQRPHYNHKYYTDVVIYFEHRM